ncbi:DUF1553 domain-containing protein [bacterium]|nr:DUF1553 domain-containing protein [bacterium]
MVAGFLILTTLSVASSPALGAEKIDFQRQVQPILADRCFHCHGPDSQNQDSELRLDSQKNIFADLGGYRAVVPGDLKASQLHTRIHSDDKSLVMPPPDSNRSLSAEDKRILDLWIEQGAPYEGHWSFTPLKKPELPQKAIEDSDWPEATKKEWSANPIDQFIARRLIEEGLQPSDPADPATRLRRASLTLTGMLPPEDLQKRFLADPTPQAYEKAVDELLGSINFAERQTLRWLDAARYADTDGYQNDNERTNWPWRDWVIQSIHHNMPFDQFTIEQLAGDMLPEATDSQKLATVFNRNHRQNGEAGALADEFFTENVIDRVETTSTVWLGLTMGCARCHDHKYDPLSQREFYQFFGYFNNIGERGTGQGKKSNPLMKVDPPFAEVKPTTLAAIEEAAQEVEAAKSGLDERMQKWLADYDSSAEASKETWSIGAIQEAKLTGPGNLTFDEQQLVHYAKGSGGGQAIVYDITLRPGQGEIAALRLETLPDPALTKPRQLAPSVNGNFVLSRFSILYQGKEVPLESVAATFEQTDYPVKNILDKKSNTGWAVFGPNVKPEPVSAMVKLGETLKIEDQQSLTIQLRFESQFADHVIGKLRVSFSADPNASLDGDSGPSPEIQAALNSKERSAKQLALLRTYYESLDQPLSKAQAKLKQAEAKRNAELGNDVTVMVMQERDGEPTPIYLLNRGQYNEPVKDDPLSRGVPTSLLASEDASQPKDRLELARWVASGENPLTARVIVNRIWQEHFGTGLVKTVGDFGLQGEVPSHPQLLDWLAIRFIQSGWDVQAMHRLIVTSATYQESSVQSAKLHEIDPSNRLLARGPRFRVDGFTVRDIALQASGLLNPEVGGPPVKPYQPEGLWESVAASAGTRYREDSGDQRYRKSMYTYWKRAVNPPRQTIFDAGGREVCNVRARRTNTPLQALVLMNDKTFIETARALAERVLKSDEQGDQARIASMYHFAIALRADEQTLSVLQENLNFFRQHFKDNPEQAAKLLAVGASPRDASLDPVEHAAYTAVAHLILNLDEFMTVE